MFALTLTPSRVNFVRHTHRRPIEPFDQDEIDHALSMTPGPDRSQKRVDAYKIFVQRQAAKRAYEVSIQGKAIVLPPAPHRYKKRKTPGKPTVSLVYNDAYAHDVTTDDLLLGTELRRFQKADGLQHEKELERMFRARRNVASKSDGPAPTDAST